MVRMTLRRQRLQQRIFVGTEKMFRREKTLHQLHAVFSGAGEFPISFQHGELFLLARPPVSQFYDVLDRIVLGAGDSDEIHGVVNPGSMMLFT